MKSSSSNNSSEENSKNSELEHLSVDTRGLVKLTGYCRQRLHAIRRDSKLDFPIPIQIGRSVRWMVADIIAWQGRMKSMGVQSVVYVAKADAKLSPHKSSKQRKDGVPDVPTRRFGLTEQFAPTLKSIEAVNAKICRPLRHDQVRTGSFIVTSEGAVVMQYRLQVVADVRGALYPVLTIRRFSSRPPVLMEAQRPSSGGRQLSPLDLCKADAAYVARLTEHPVAVFSDSIAPANSRGSINEIRAEYENGASLDSLCKRYRMSKSTLSIRLKQAGAEMRAPGRARKSKTL